MPGSRTLSLAAFVAAAGFALVAAAHPSADDRLRALELQMAETHPSAQLLVDHGRANLQAGRWQEALDDADGALALELRSSAALLLRAETLYAAGYVDRALAAADALLAVAPASAAGRHLRARVLREVGRLAEAAAEYDCLLREQTRPLPETYIERAEVLTAIGRPQEAIVGLDDGVARLGEVVTLRLAAIDIAVRAGDFEGAIDRIERLLKQAPSQVFWMTRRAEILEAGGRYSEARRAFASADAALPAARISAVRQLKERIDAGRKRLEPGDPREENG